MRMCAELQVILLLKHAEPPTEEVLIVTLDSEREKKSARLGLKKDFRIKALRRLCKEITVHEEMRREEEM